MKHENPSKCSRCKTDLDPSEVEEGRCEDREACQRRIVGGRRTSDAVSNERKCVRCGRHAPFFEEGVGKVCGRDDCRSNDAPSDEDEVTPSGAAEVRQAEIDAQDNNEVCTCAQPPHGPLIRHPSCPRHGKTVDNSPNVVQARLLLRRAFDCPDAITMLVYIERANAKLGGYRLDKAQVTPKPGDIATTRHREGIIVGVITGVDDGAVDLSGFPTDAKRRAKPFEYVHNWRVIRDDDLVILRPAAEARTDYPEGTAPDGMFVGALVRNAENGLLGIVKTVNLRGARVFIGKRGKTQYWQHPEVFGMVVPPPLPKEDP